MPVRNANSTHFSCLRNLLNSTHPGHGLHSLRAKHAFVWHALPQTPPKRRLERANLPRVFSLLKQRRMRWFGHGIRIDDERILKKLLFGKLPMGIWPTAKSKLRYKEFFKRELKALQINTWVTKTSDRNDSLQTGRDPIKDSRNFTCLLLRRQMKQRRKERQFQRDTMNHIYTQCGKTATPALDCVASEDAVKSILTRAQFLKDSDVLREWHPKSWP